MSIVPPPTNPSAISISTKWQSATGNRSVPVKQTSALKLFTIVLIRSISSGLLDGLLQIRSCGSGLGNVLNKLLPLLNLMQSYNPRRRLVGEAVEDAGF
jgi:hypothetical protein